MLLLLIRIAPLAGCHLAGHACIYRMDVYTVYVTCTRTGPCWQHSAICIAVLHTVREACMHCMAVKGAVGHCITCNQLHRRGSYSLRRLMQLFETKDHSRLGALHGTLVTSYTSHTAPSSAQ